MLSYWWPFWLISTSNTLNTASEEKPSHISWLCSRLLSLYWRRGPGGLKARILVCDDKLNHIYKLCICCRWRCWINDCWCYCWLRVAEVGSFSANAKMATNFSLGAYLLLSQQTCRFARNCKFGNVIQHNMQYLPCNCVRLAQEKILTQKNIFLPKS